jgi:hypothetical protein
MASPLIELLITIAIIEILAATLFPAFAQPTPINDDLLSGLNAAKSLKYSAGEADALMERMLDDAMRFTHAPLCVNFHPSNYVRFSQAPSRALLERASIATDGLEYRALAQLLACARFVAVDGVQLGRSAAGTECSWDGATLRARLEGAPGTGLTQLLPMQTNGQALSHVLCDGRPVALPETDVVVLSAEYLGE